MHLGDLLVAMADAAGGVYVAGQAEPARLDRWYEYVAGKPKREFKSATAQELAPRYGYFVLLAIVLLVLEMMMRSAPRGHDVNRVDAVRARPRLWAGYRAAAGSRRRSGRRSRCAKAMRSTGRANTRRRCASTKRRQESCPIRR